MHKKSYILSVIIPVYNSEKYIARCLDSLVAQTLDDMEIICIDDGSSDNGIDVLRKYQQQYPNIKILSQTNSGPSAARNNGVRNSCGKYIAFVDSDDYVDPEMYSELVNAAELHDLDFVMCNFVNEYANQPSSLPGIDLPAMKVIGRDEIAEYIFPELMRDGCFSGPCNKIYRSELLERLKMEMPENLRYGEDTVFQLEMYDKLDRMFYIDKPYYHYVHRSNSLSSGSKEMLNPILIPLYTLRSSYAKRWGISENVVAEYFCYRVMMDILQSMKDQAVSSWLRILWQTSHNSVVASALASCNLSKNKYTAKIRFVFSVCKIFSKF